MKSIERTITYAMTCSRPDLAWVVTKLSQHLAKPTRTDWMIIDHVLRYVKATLSHKLFYSKTTNGLRITGFSDSDWASNTEDRRSTTGFIFGLNENGGAITWKSRKQPTVALSSCEAEYMALSAATQGALSTVYRQFIDTGRHTYTDTIER